MEPSSALPDINFQIVNIFFCVCRLTLFIGPCQDMLLHVTERSEADTEGMEKGTEGWIYNFKHITRFLLGSSYSRPEIDPPQRSCLQLKPSLVIGLCITSDFSCRMCLKISKALEWRLVAFTSDWALTITYSIIQTNWESPLWQESCPVAWTVRLFPWSHLAESLPLVLVY